MVVTFNRNELKSHTRLSSGVLTCGSQAMSGGGARRQSTNNQDLILLTEESNEEKLPVIRKSIGRIEIPNAIVDAKYSDKRMSHLSRENLGPLIKTTELVPIDMLLKCDLNLSCVEDSQMPGRQRRMTDLPRHGRVAPSVLKKNLEKLSRNKAADNINNRSFYTQSSQSIPLVSQALPVMTGQRI